MDRDEGQLAVLGSRLLEDQKKVGETAEAIRLRQSGESSILGSIASSVSESLTQVARWAYWWNSTEETPEDVRDAQVLVELNTDFSISGLSSDDLREIVRAWQAGAISQDTMLELFRKGEILPDGRSNSEEVALLNSKPKAAEAGGEVVTS
jgi:transcription initiation factor TFIID subunit TAF12